MVKIIQKSINSLTVRKEKTEIRELETENPGGGREGFGQSQLKREEGMTGGKLGREQGRSCMSLGVRVTEIIPEMEWANCFTKKRFGTPKPLTNAVRNVWRRRREPWTLPKTFGDAFMDSVSQK